MYRTFAPEPPLDQFISCYWMIQAARSPHDRLDELILPDGQSDLIFCLNTSCVPEAGEAEPGTTPLETCLDVTRTKPVRVQLAGAVDIVGVRFRIGGLSAFQPTPLADLTGEAVAVADVFGSVAPPLKERLAEADLPEERVAILDEFLVTQLAPHPQHQLVEHVIDVFRAPGGQRLLSHIAEELGCSVRTIRRVFRRLVGHSPKTCARLLRFRGAWQSIRDRSRRSYTTAAYKWGYYDQSHFIREFKRFTGMTPTEYQDWLQDRMRTKEAGWGGAMTPEEYRSWLSKRAFTMEHGGRNIQSAYT